MKNLEKKSGSHYFELLSTLEQAQFRANVLSHGMLEMENILESKFTCFKRFVGSCFSFKDSIEGEEYWREICESQRDGVSDEDADASVLIDILKLLISDSASEILGESFLGEHPAQELLDKMEPEHFAEWEKEFLRQRSVEKDSFYALKYKSLKSLIMSSFGFKESEKGGKYWSELCDYYEAKEATTNFINDLGLTREDESN